MSRKNLSDCLLCSIYIHLTVITLLNHLTVRFLLPGIFVSLASGKIWLPFVPIFGAGSGIAGSRIQPEIIRYLRRLLVTDGSGGTVFIARQEGVAATSP